MNEYRNTKVVFLGESACGKTSIAKRFINDSFCEYTESTVGAAFCVKQMPDYGIKFEIWDTAGQERYKSLAPMYYRGASAAIIVYDITIIETFTKAKRWLEELEKSNNKYIYIILVGNKLDLNSHRKIYPEDINKLIGDKYIHIEASAKTGQNINEIFTTIARNLQNPELSTSIDNSKSTLNLNDNPKKKKNCCRI